MTPALGPAELARYARQLVLPQLGPSGQQRLASSRVLVVGAGGLGSPALLYLAAAGVGTLGVVDDDDVELSNLHRQVLHASAAVGHPKTRSAAESVARLNPATTVVEHRARLRPGNAAQIVRDYQIVVDGSDTLDTRYLVSDTCTQLGLPHVWGAVLGFQGQASVWWAGRGPCYRCVFPEPAAGTEAPSCEQTGVLGPVCAVIGSVQATEALKVLLGIGEPLVGRMLLHDGLRQSWDSLPLRADPACPACGRCVSREGRPEVPPPGERRDADVVATVRADELSAHLAATGALIVDVRDKTEQALTPLPGALAVRLDEFLTGAAFLRPELADAARPVVVCCRSGSRSAQAVRLAHRAGFPMMRSLDGGVLALPPAPGPRGASMPGGGPSARHAGECPPGTP